MKDWKKFAWLAGIFLVAYFLPLGNPKVDNAVLEAFRLLQWYAINHTLACVVPAMFIAGAISTFLSQASIIRYLGPDSNRTLAYGVASVSGTILAVCSCSVLPMFAGIYAMHKGNHIRVEILYDLFTPKLKSIARWIGLVCFLIFIIALILQGSRMAWMSLMVKEKLSGAFRIPVYPLKILIPITAFLFLLEGIVVFTRRNNKDI